MSQRLGLKWCVLHPPNHHQVCAFQTRWFLSSFFLLFRWSPPPTPREIRYPWLPTQIFLNMSPKQHPSRLSPICSQSSLRRPFSTPMLANWNWARCFPTIMPNLPCLCPPTRLLWRWPGSRQLLSNYCSLGCMPDPYRSWFTVTKDRNWPSKLRCRKSNSTGEQRRMSKDGFLLISSQCVDHHSMVLM